MTKRYSKQITLGIALFISLLLVGCGTVPIYNINDAPVQVDTNDLSANDVKKAIIRAGISLGWKIKEVEPGKLVGLLNLRRHMAKIDIPYSKEGYSLIYVDSSELNYDAEKGEIHKNYNKWIRNLDQKIQMQLFSF